MAITYTQDQQKVIDLHNSNILVSAAAGSGKTAVLVERIIQMICNEEQPVDIDRLLIVTFTKAAAAEMRERIAASVAAKLLEKPESEHLQRQSALLHNAQITTIHSFCQFLIRNHFNEIGLDPAFRVADPGEIKLLSQEVMEELFEEEFQKEDQNFHDCIEFFCPDGKERKLEKYILNLWEYASSMPWPEEWLKERKKDYEDAEESTFAQTKCGLFMQQMIHRLLKGCLEKYKRAIKICEAPAGPYMYGEMMEKEAEQIEALLSYQQPEVLETKIEAVETGRLSSKKDDSVDPALREQAKALRDAAKDILEGIKKDYFETPLSVAMRQASMCVQPVSKLIDLCISYNHKMKEKKAQKKLVDFSDMEHYALDILLHREDGRVVPSAVAVEYRQYFHEVLTDEYQDSNLVQEYLLQAVSGEDDGKFNRFMVGDVKQSIYRFRLARPELFLEKYHTYEEEGKCQRIDLSKNFRSRKQVVDTVNEIFSAVMSEENGGIVYDEHAALYPGAQYPENKGCESEMWLIEDPGKEDELGKKKTEALFIAGRIKKLLQEYEVTDKQTGILRPVTLRDMVILLRSGSGYDEEFKEVLEEEGIPVFITSKTGYFETTEIKTLLQFLRVIDNPIQDIPLFGVMKSVFGGFSEEEIANIRIENKDVSLYEALSLCEEKKAVDFVKMLNRYRDYAVYMPIRELLQTLIEEFHYLHYVAALPAGAKRKSNVEMLLTKASDFELTSYHGLFHFVRYIEKLDKYEVDYGEADNVDENADVLRIMTIHKSKGLEFPVTFVAGLGKQINMSDVKERVLIDADFGLAVNYVDAKRRIRNKTLRHILIAQKQRADALAEELRVLYVALTRAKEKLIMTATMVKAEENWEKAKAEKCDCLSYVDYWKTRCLIDFMLPILPNTGVKVQLADLSLLGENELQEQLSFAEKREKLKHAEEYADADILQLLQDKFSFRYPHKELEKLYTKTTVSELKIAAMSDSDEAAYHQFEEKEIVPYIPLFKREEEAVSGTVRGNAFHRAMEILDFDRLFAGFFDNTCPQNYEDFLKGIKEKELEQILREQLEAYVEKKRLQQVYYEALSLRKLTKFLMSDLAYRMWRAHRNNELYREQPFVLGVEATRLKEEFPKEERVLIQGIIDVFFVEQEEIVLLDYKTDKIGSMKDLWARYSTQIDYYKEAIERLMRKKVKEAYLYSFSLEKYED